MGWQGRGKRREGERRVRTTRTWRQLQEIGHGGAGRDGSLVVGDGIEDLELPVQVLVQGQDGGHIATPVAVVGSRPDSHEVLLVKHVLVALLDQLMGTADELEAIDVDELGGHPGPEQPARPSGRHLPRLNVLRVRPHQILITVIER